MSNQLNHSLKDSEYLKRYLETHPDNQMAWYLLGREYAAKEALQKAEYCFRKAGNVYKVFEQIPSVDFNHSQSQHLALKDIPYKRGWRFIQRTFLWSVLGFLLFHVPVHSPATSHLAIEENSDSYRNLEVESNPTESISPISEWELNHERNEELQVYYTIEEQGQEQLEQFLGQIVFPNHQLSETSLLVNASLMDGKRWINWLEQPRMLLSAQRDTTTGSMNIDFFDAGSCYCIPSDASDAMKDFARWQEEEEHRMVLYSALHHYDKQHTDHIESIDQLSLDYPGNNISGYSTLMKRMFDKWIAVPTDEIVNPTDEETNLSLEEVNPNQVEANSNQGNQTGLSFGLTGVINEMNIAHLKQPLELIIDKENYRLAIVSGDILIRNYPVGLGGERTPEGEFVISEKVKNPNGRTDGEFGSRGMTLSDTLYAIHGTDKPNSIGKDDSLGCIRMLMEDVEELYAMIPMGSKVTIVPSGLPEEVIRSQKAFAVPAKADETNPNKVYKWLN